METIAVVVTTIIKVTIIEVDISNTKTINSTKLDTTTAATMREAEEVITTVVKEEGEVAIEVGRKPVL